MSLSQVLKAGEPIARLPGKQLYNHAVLEDGDVLLQTDSTLYRLAPDGSQRWAASGRPCTRELVGPQDTVLLGTEGGYAPLDLETGKLGEVRVHPTHAYAPEVGPEGELVFATSKSSALRVEEGRQPQEFRIASNGFTHFFRSKCPTMAAVAPDGAVTVFEAFDGVCREKDGTVRWRYTFADAVGQQQYLRGNWLFHDNSGRLIALDPNSGGVRWQTSGHSPNGCNIHADCVTPGPEGIVYFHPVQSKLYALDEKTGKVLFRHGQDAPDPRNQIDYQYGAELGADGRLYVGHCDRDTLDILDPRTGAFLGTLPRQGHRPIVAGNLVVSEQDFGLRVDPLQPSPPSTTAVQGGGIEQAQDWLVVGGTVLRSTVSPGSQDSRTSPTRL